MRAITPDDRVSFDQFQNDVGLSIAIHQVCHALHPEDLLSCDTPDLVLIAIDTENEKVRNLVCRTLEQHPAIGQRTSFENAIGNISAKFTNATRQGKNDTHQFERITKSICKGYFHSHLNRDYNSITRFMSMAKNRKNILRFGAAKEARDFLKSDHHEIQANSLILLWDQFTELREAVETALNERARPFKEWHKAQRTHATWGQLIERRLIDTCKGSPENCVLAYKALEKSPNKEQVISLFKKADSDNIDEWISAAKHIERDERKFPHVITDRIREKLCAHFDGYEVWRSLFGKSHTGHAFFRQICVEEMAKFVAGPINSECNNS